MRRFLLAASLLSVLAASVHAQPINQTARRMQSGTSLPATCFSSVMVRDIFLLTTGTTGIYTCTAANTWTISASVSYPLLAPNGTAAAPSYSFASSTGTGMFLDSANVLAFATSGVERWVINSSGAFNPITTNANDIGTSGAVPRDVNVGRNAVLWGSTSGFVSLHAAAAAGSGDLTLPTGTDVLVGRASTDTLTSKSISLASNTLTGTTAQFNTALTDNDFATLAGSEALSNKTLTTPTIASFVNATHTHQSAAAGGTLDAAAISAGALALARGGTNANLSATGGTSQVLQQTSVGGAITVGQLAASNLSNGTTGSSSVVLTTSPTITTPTISGHVTASGTVPTINNCGTSSTFAAGSNDSVGRITIGNALPVTQCVINFATAWTTAPVCYAQNETAPDDNTAVATTTTLTIAGVNINASNADKLGYRCIGF